MTFALATFVQATFVHTRNILAVTDPILMKLLLTKILFATATIILMGLDTIKIKLVNHKGDLKGGGVELRLHKADFWILLEHLADT